MATKKQKNQVKSFLEQFKSNTQPQQQQSPQSSQQQSQPEEPTGNCPKCHKGDLILSHDGRFYCPKCFYIDKSSGVSEEARKEKYKGSFSDALGKLKSKDTTKKDKAKAVGGVAKAGTQYLGEVSGVSENVRAVGKKGKTLIQDWIKAILWGFGGGIAAPVNAWMLVTMLIVTIPGLSLPFVSYYYNRYASPYLGWTKQGMLDFWWWWWLVPVCIVIFISLGLLAVWLSTAKGTQPSFFGPGLSKGMFVTSIALGIINFAVFPAINYAAATMNLDQKWCPPGIPLCQANRQVDKIAGVYESLKIDDNNIKEKWTQSGNTVRAKVKLSNSNPLDPEKEDLYTVRNIKINIKDEKGEMRLGGAIGLFSEEYPYDLRPQETKEAGVEVNGLTCSADKQKKAQDTGTVLYEDKKMIIETSYSVELESKKQMEVSFTEKERTAVGLGTCKSSPGPIDLCLSFEEDRYPISYTYTDNPKYAIRAGFFGLASAQGVEPNPVKPMIYISLTNTMNGDGRFQSIKIKQNNAKGYSLELDNCDGVELGKCDKDICIEGNSKEFTIKFKGMNNIDEFTLSSGRPTESLKTGVYGNLRDIFCVFKKVDLPLSNDEPRASFEFIGISSYTYIDRKETVTGIYCSPIQNI